MRFKDNGKFNTVYGKTLLGFHLIQGHARSGAFTFNTRNPANQQDRVALFPAGSAAELQQVLALPLDARWPAGHLRHETFAHLTRLLQAHQKTWIRLLTRERGKPERQIQSEFETVLTRAHFFAAGAPDHSVAEDTSGAVLLSDIANTITDTAEAVFAALFAGQPLIWLPCRQSSVSAWMLSHMCLEAGFAPDALQLLHGRETPAESQTCPSEWLAVIKDSRRVVFQPPTASPLCHLLQSEEEIPALLQSLQTAQARGVLVLRAQRERLCQALLKKLTQVRIGDPGLERRVQCGPLATPQQLATFLHQLSTEEAGSWLYRRGRISRDSKPEPFVGDPDQGLYVWPAMRVIDTLEQLFTAVGPTLCLLEVADQAQAQAVLSQLQLYQRLAP